MSINTPYESKMIDELQELGKLSGNEKFVISINNGEDTRKVSTDTLVGYAVSIINSLGTPVTMSLVNSGSSYNNQCIIFVEEGTEVPIPSRNPGCFYLEEQRQTSIRTQINLPTSVKVSSNLGLRRV